MRPWSVHRIGDIYDHEVMANVEGTKYAYAVCEPYWGGRLKAAWWVLTGRAFAFEWPKAGDLEAAIGLPLFDRAARKAKKPVTLGDAVESARGGPAPPRPSQGFA